MVKVIDRFLSLFINLLLFCVQCESKIKLFYWPILKNWYKIFLVDNLRHSSSFVFTLEGKDRDSRFTVTKSSRYKSYIKYLLIQGINIP